MTRFEDKVVVVTGAGKGIGAATAEAIGREGGAVVAFDADADAVGETVERILKAGGRAIALVGDVRNAADVEFVVQTAVTEFGGIDALAAIAGLLRLSPTESSPDEHWREVMETNVRGPFMFCRAVVPHLRSRGGGAIVLAASAMAFASSSGAALYSASKGAVVAMTRSLAVEYASEDIRVNCFAPGTVRTPMVRELAAISGEDDLDGLVEQFGAAHPMRRIIEPEEIARVVLFLLSEDASAVTGSCYVADAGMLARLG